MGLILLACAAIGLKWLAARGEPETATLDESLQSLRKPFQEVDVFEFLDGGTVGVFIRDRGGAEQYLSIPNKIGDPRAPYSSVFVGAKYYLDPGAVEVRDSDAAKQWLLAVLREYRGGDPYATATAAKLRRGWLDYYHLWKHRVRGEW